MTGHNQPWDKCASFLRQSLTANQDDPSLRIALARTVLFAPCSALVVPIVDTPGTDDANPLNADLTQQAVNEAIEKSSRLLLFGGPKSLTAEGSLSEHLIKYLQHMITSKSSRPAVKVVLSPGLHVIQPEHLARPEQLEQNTQRETVSMDQLRTWLGVANQFLPKRSQVSNDRLEQLLQRCEAKVVYMQLYTSLCLQTATELDSLANAAELTANELLQLTKGPWLLGVLLNTRCLKAHYKGTSVVQSGNMLIADCWKQQVDGAVITAHACICLLRATCLVQGCHVSFLLRQLSRMWQTLRTSTCNSFDRGWRRSCKHTGLYRNYS